MKIAHWNVKGLGVGEKEGMVRKFIRYKKLSFLGLVETKKGNN